MIGWLLLAAALVVLLFALRIRRSTGLPWAIVRATDTGGWRQLDAPLISQRAGIIGKPDYVLETRGGLVPVEVKPRRTASAPYDGDMLQLAAYCVLIEDTTGVAPRYGLLRYAEHTFKLRYTSAVRAEVLRIVAAMRDDMQADDVPRSHAQAARCRGCGLAYACDDRLA
jgi:CRISPR-associated exonuclease Cas4